MITAQKPATAFQPLVTMQSCWIIIIIKCKEEPWSPALDDIFNKSVLLMFSVLSLPLPAHNQMCLCGWWTVFWLIGGLTDRSCCYSDFTLLFTLVSASVSADLNLKLNQRSGLSWKGMRNASRDESEHARLYVRRRGNSMFLFTFL